MRWTKPRTNPSSAGPGWTFGPWDTAVAAGLLTATLAVCLPVALHLHGEVRELDRQRAEVLERTKQATATLEHMEARKAAMGRLRRAVTRYVAEVEARPIVAWGTAVGELSRRRPQGVWTTRILGSGPQFRAQVSAQRPELLADYLRLLRESAYVEFVTLPAGEPVGGVTATGPTTAQVAGRWMGD